MRKIVVACVLAAAAAGLPAPSNAQQSQQSQAATACLSKPNAPPPSGRHWYYRTDRSLNRRCWYLGNIGERTNRRANRGAAASRTASRPSPPPSASAPREDVEAEPPAATAAPVEQQAASAVPLPQQAAEVPVRQPDDESFTIGSAEGWPPREDAATAEEDDSASNVWPDPSPAPSAETSAAIEVPIDPPIPAATPSPEPRSAGAAAIAAHKPAPAEGPNSVLLLALLFGSFAVAAISMRSIIQSAR